MILKFMLAKLFFILNLCLFSQSVFADAASDIDFIVQAKHPPKGVVFEVVEGRKEALQIALQMIETYSAKLKAAVPNIKFAVVSHGSEQFALLKSNKTEYNNTHAKVQSLVASDVPVHVCGTHASWYDLKKTDFVDYVDVADAGPAKIREYQRMGYALIIIDVP